MTSSYKSSSGGTSGAGYKTPPHTSKTGFSKASAPAKTAKNWGTLAAFVLAAFYTTEGWYHVDQAEKHGFIETNSLVSQIYKEVAYDIGDAMYFFTDKFNDIREALGEPSIEDDYPSIAHDERLKIMFQIPILYDQRGNVQPADTFLNKFYEYQKAFVLNRVGFKGTDIGQKIAHNKHLTVELGIVYDTMKELPKEEQERIEMLREKDPDQAALQLSIYAGQKIMSIFDASRNPENLNTGHSAYYNTAPAFLEKP